MMLLKLTLLTLLIVVPDLHVSGETIVTCEHHTAVLNCGARRIRVIGALYGRTDLQTCAAGGPHKQIYNTRCSAPQAAAKVRAR
ncbi:hypothetical protein AMELA_G00287110 [Ameiurus melas]|uniref:Uncharacterized protein n=1 Tax=Ameiurus melas TaxID=219545 RepID=A0A7J5ZLB3_AMEME|nr:hypothetical protein AMELA_G00287110 [Ameiurus melas]